MSVFMSMRRARTLRPLLLSVATALLATACALEPPKPPSTRDPADVGQATPPLSDVPVLSGYVSLRPAAPDSWLDQNRRVTPPSKP